MSDNNTLPSPSRRRFVSVSAAAVAAGSLSSLAFADSPQTITEIAKPTGDPSTAIRRLRIHVPESQLVDMRRRIKATRWPDRETVSDTSQGIQLATIQGLAEYWANGYDWRKVEARLNALPQYVTEIDGLDIHFMHIRSKHENAMPLIVTHGWPGSVIEQLKIIDPLVNPTAYGASASDAFHLVIPSLPGYGFSARPTTTGWGPERTARAWVQLMKRVGYDKFASQGGDLGGIITNIMAKQAPPELIGIHVNFPAAVPAEVIRSITLGEPVPANFSDDEKHAYEQLSANFMKKRGYAIEMGTRPQTLYGLADSPVALASWMLDHGDGYGQPAAAITSAVLGHPIADYAKSDITRDDVLDDITLYWVTNTGISASRFYWESHANFFLSADVSVPAAVSAFPGENFQAPRSWTERAYHNLIYYNRPEIGGHFAAWEQPLLFANEVRAGLRPLRT